MDAELGYLVFAGRGWPVGAVPAVYGFAVCGGDFGVVERYPYHDAAVFRTVVGVGMHHDGHFYLAGYDFVFPVLGADLAAAVFPDQFVGKRGESALCRGEIQLIHVGRRVAPFDRVCVVGAA